LTLCHGFHFLSSFFPYFHVFLASAAYEYITKKSDSEDIAVSRLFIYYNGRAKENPSSITDSGCTMTNGIEALEESGVCLESIWPYDISQVNARPTDEAYQDAKGHTITEALQVNIALNDMKSCLAQGFPFAFGLRLFTSFDKAATSGVVPMPSSADRSRQSDGRSDIFSVVKNFS
jgi:C1A family cysteine protease